ncbi:hypothetical protein BDV96DRAFT_599255 [Lophiotrema nucula]|uniref:RelA/SpoT domain-containing protein n=1 Tax=Lophiotrema nucula TaxID=690887 RepID=A0A6A5Z8C7_9PLEO|nr:hypothetical protein BDV96DRAFT_599255 [Lophiotrema nucula]
MTGAVDKFVEAWAMEQYFWRALTTAAKTICEDEVQHRLKLKCNIFSRTKSQESIRGSIERRQKTRGTPYKTKKEIEQDMIDLSGIRIILTFPGDVHEVQQFLETAFDDVHRSFWGLDENGNTIVREEKGRFIGYRATHFVVKWKGSDEKCRYGTEKDHVGKKIEVQVTSTAMYAWQQAHHDLVYKQLQGNPSEEEGSLLEMINGLAHAGMMALTQLQTLSRRRIEESTRDFADEYEVGVWLKTHLKALLPFKSTIHAPFLERSAVLFDIMSLFDLRTPAKFQNALTWPPARSHAFRLDQDFAGILHETLSKEKDEDTWSEAFHNDPADWAIFRICVHSLEESDILLDLGNIEKARIKAFCFVNTINFALSEPLRHDFIKTIVQDVFSGYRTERDKRAAINSLFALVTENHLDGVAPQDDHSQQLVQEIELLWLNLLKCIIVKRSTFLCIALVLSLAGIAFLPREEQQLFWDEQASRFIVWPFTVGPDEPDITQSMGLEVASVSTNEQRKYKLEGLKWIRTRISLVLIIRGRGWRPPVDEDPAVANFASSWPLRRTKLITNPNRRETENSSPTKNNIERRIRSLRSPPEVFPSSSQPRESDASYTEPDFDSTLNATLSLRGKAEREFSFETFLKPKPARENVRYPSSLRRGLAAWRLRKSDQIRLPPYEQT